MSPHTPNPSGPTGPKNQAQGRRKAKALGCPDYISPRPNWAREPSPGTRPSRGLPTRAHSTSGGPLSVQAAEGSGLLLESQPSLAHGVHLPAFVSYQSPPPNQPTSTIPNQPFPTSHFSLPKTAPVGWPASKALSSRTDQPTSTQPVSMPHSTLPALQHGTRKERQHRDRVRGLRDRGGP